MEIILFAAVLVSFILARIALPRWIRRCRKVDLVWEDMNKYDRPKNVAASGGVVIVFSFVLSVLVYVAIRTFVLGDTDGVSLQIFAMLSTLLLLGMVGLVDDYLGWKHHGLSKRMRIFLCLICSIPLAVINAGNHPFQISLLGGMNIGILYPLIVIPFAVTLATTTFNFLAGFNGLEAGLGIIVISFLSFIAYVTGSSWLSLIGLCMVASLAVFYYYNRVPAKVFPGDILTYAIGAFIAIMAILGNFEKIAILVFAPYIIETILKSRGGLTKQSFGVPQRDGSLKMPYDKVYGLTHLAILILSKFKKKVYEKDVVYLIFLFQILTCIVTLIIFRRVLF